MSRATLALPLVLAAALSGCAGNLSGVGGTQTYACKAPAGAICTSVSGVYANALHGMAVVPRPPQPIPATASASETSATRVAAATGPTAAREPAPATSAAVAPTATASWALRSNPRVLRLWIAPWEDADGDLHEGSVVHVVVDTGRWLVERVRPAARSQLDAVTPPRLPATAPATPPAEPSPPPARWQTPAVTQSPDVDTATER